MKTEQGRDPAAAKAEYEALRDQIETLEARRKEVAEELRASIESGHPPDGVKLIPVRSLSVPEPAAFLRGLKALADHTEYDKLYGSILRQAVKINAARAAELIEKAELPELYNDQFAVYFSVTTSERLDVR